MALLHNRISHKELREQILNDTTPRTTISFYKYFTINEPQAFRDALYIAFKQLGVLGRIYIAHEGINAQCNIPSANVQALRNYLNTIPQLLNIRLNEALQHTSDSFFVLKVKLRPQIVADGITDPSFNPSNTGTYLNALQYNELIAQQPNTVVVDMRNHYEYEVGHFKNAIEIPSDSFKAQLPMAIEMLEQYKHEPIVMYCTGGIRCEKASAYLKHNGFTNVHHLEGGIINYAQQAKANNLNSEFIGKNFVFDERLGERITEDIIAHCHQCGQPADTHINCRNEGCHLLFIQCAECKQAMQGCCSQACFDIIQLPVQEQIALRKGIMNDAKIFNKSKDKRLSLGKGK
jgi:UPF0176 protein